MKYFLFTLLGLSFILLYTESCHPVDLGDPVLIDTNKQLPNTFLSSKLGSYWEYGSKGDSTAKNYTRYATGLDSVKEGLKLSYYQRKDHINWYVTPEYFGIYDSSLVTLIDLDGSETHYLPYVFYIRGAKIGDTWNNTGTVHYQSITVNISIVSSLMEKNLTLSWGNKTYENVYHVKSNLYAGNNQLHSGTLDLWFNDGLGIIKGSADINILSGAYTKQYTDSLVDYYIAP